VPALSLFESTLYARTYQPVGTSDGLSVGIDWIHHVEETAVRNLNAAARSDFARLHSTFAVWLLSAGTIWKSLRRLITFVAPDGPTSPRGPCGP
jgi:hypothetical protein